MPKETKKAELVLIPAPGVGHITSAIEMANLLADHNEQFSATVLIMKPPTDQNLIPESQNPCVRFVKLRRKESASQGPAPPHLALFRLIDDHKAHVREILAEIANSKTSNLAGLVIDMFCTSMIDVANEFGIPSYLFYTSGASILGLMFHVQSLRDNYFVDVTQYQDSDAEILVPTYANLVPAKVLPSGFFEKGGGDIFIDQAKRYRETKGVLINTFQELESHAIRALSNDETIPPVYAIGPLLKLNDSNNQNQETDSIKNWLDLQPDSSVVFLCFGSMGTFGSDQVKEIAHALEHSGCRFLWSLRRPPPKSMIGYIPENYENPEEVLPEGFLERTSEVGKIIGWAPQAAILSHPAVGGFVSHCGWNSTLESIWFGVPMAGWPIFAEQQVNAFLLVEDLGLAVDIKMDYRINFGTENPDIVGADVIENGIKELMDPEKGIKNKMKGMQEKGRLAITEGGSSSASLEDFLNNVIDNIPRR